MKILGYLPDGGLSKRERRSILMSESNRKNDSASILILWDVIKLSHCKSALRKECNTSASSSQLRNLLEKQLHWVHHLRVKVHFFHCRSVVYFVCISSICTGRMNFNAILAVIQGLIHSVFSSRKLLKLIKLIYLLLPNILYSIIVRDEIIWPVLSTNCQCDGR